MKRSLPTVLCTMLAAGLTAFGLASAMTPPDKAVICDILNIDQGQWSAMSGEEKMASIKALPLEDRRTLHQLIGQKTNSPDRAPLAINSDESTRETLGRKSRAVGTISYDNGIPGFVSPTGQLMGNKFNQAISASGAIVGVEPNGTITGFSAYMQYVPPPGGPGTIQSSAVSWAIFGPESTGGNAQRLANGFFAGGSGWVLHTLAAPVSYTGSSFHVEIMAFQGYSWQPTSSAPTFMYSQLAPAGTVGTFSGLGTHGAMMAQAATAPVNNLPFNMVVRASGNVIVPVELMNFTIE